MVQAGLVQNFLLIPFKPLAWREKPLEVELMLPEVQADLLCSLDRPFHSLFGAPMQHCSHMTHRGFA